MDQYTDDERVEDLKKWWQENGASIIAGVTLGVLAIFGWQYWSSYRDSKAEQASQAYDAFIIAAEKPDIDQARQRSQTLITDFPKSPYSALAALRLAKLASDSGDTATAIQHLETVIANTTLDEIKDIARLRLARLLFATGRAADAEQRLSQVATASLSAEREELRGDLALAANDLTKARSAFTAALAASGGSPLLQLKLDSLTAPTADAVIPAPTTPAVPPPTETPPTATTPPDLPSTTSTATGGVPPAMSDTNAAVPAATTDTPSAPVSAASGSDTALSPQPPTATAVPVAPAPPAHEAPPTPVAPAPPTPGAPAASHSAPVPPAPTSGQ
jgi:predicted negative regulator of RcsB-dependent stress response